MEKAANRVSANQIYLSNREMVTAFTVLTVFWYAAYLFGKNISAWKLEKLHSKTTHQK